MNQKILGQSLEEGFQPFLKNQDFSDSLYERENAKYNVMKPRITKL